MILLVTYDFKQPAGSYTDFFDVLKEKDSWWHYLSSTWLVYTDESPKELSQQLVPHTFKGDRILVTELSPSRAGWLPTKAWDWIKNHE